MIEELADLVDDFPGPVNQTRCFLHILNLVVKSIIRQFDVPKLKKTSDDESDDESMDEATKELVKLVGDIDLEEEITVSAGPAGNEDDAAEDDNDEGWVNEHNEMTEEELRELVESVRPVRLLLTKVR
jgi:hypothetical protein